MTATTPTKCRILLVDDDADLRALVAGHLEAAGYEVFTASNGIEAKRVMLETNAPILLTDWHMPGMTGLELCRALRCAECLDFVYVMVFTSRRENTRLIEAFNAGADDFVTKPICREELLARLRAADRIVKLKADLEQRNREVSLVNARMAISARELQSANERLRVLATTDELTGFLNRRETMTRLKRWWVSGDRTATPLSVIILDIDHFKRFNDTHGHAVGDLVLREMAQALRAVSRASDELCRVGGEEFVIICPQTPIAGAALAAERFRAAVADQIIEHEGQPLRTTISLGVAERTADMASHDDLIRAADTALYSAKDAGRNRVHRADQLTPTPTPSA
jgi:two-component system cell cycle response regulator